MVGKKIFFFLVFLTAVLACSVFSQAAATYLVPRRDTPPVIDGKGYDEAWDDATKLYLAVGEIGLHGGWTTEVGALGARATIRIVWSDNENARGLFFLVDVTDTSPSLPVGYNAADLTRQDGFQIVFDPFYKRFQKSTDGTLRYSFVPYTRSDDKKTTLGFACWREDLYWKGGMIKALGVDMQVRLRRNTVTEQINGYTAEIFIPFSALSVNGRSLDRIEEYSTHIGIGFTLTDYTYSPKALLTGDYEAAAILKGQAADYGSSENDRDKPAEYCTLYFGTDSLPGTILHSSEKKITPPPESVISDRSRLEKELSSTANLSESRFSVESWKAMQDAYNRALLVSRMEAASQEQIDNAAEDLSSAILHLAAVEKPKQTTTFGSQKTSEYLQSAITFCCVVFALSSVFLALVLIRQKNKRENERD